MNKHILSFGHKYLPKMLKEDQGLVPDEGERRLNVASGAINNQPTARNKPFGKRINPQDSSSMQGYPIKGEDQAREEKNTQRKRTIGRSQQRVQSSQHSLHQEGDIHTTREAVEQGSPMDEYLRAASQKAQHSQPKPRPAGASQQSMSYQKVSVNSKQKSRGAQKPISPSDSAVMSQPPQREPSVNFDQKQMREPASFQKEIDYLPELTHFGEMRWGYWMIGGFILALLIWIGSIPIPIASIANGKVNVEGEKKQIQHLEGGIVKSIHVKEGERVTTGQVLVMLDNKLSNAEYESLQSQLALALSREARYNAEFYEQDGLQFDPWLKAHEQDPIIQKVMRNQKEIFYSRLNLVQEKETALQHRVEEINAKITGENRQLKLLKKQFSVVDKELKRYKRLLKQGIVTRQHLFSLEEQKVQLSSEMNQIKTNNEVAKNQIEKVNSEIQGIYQNYKHEAAENHDNLKDRIVDLRQKMEMAKNRLGRAEIVSPIDGFVLNLGVHTLGGVISPRERIMEIVPSEASLIVDVQVNPNDRDSIKIGQEAEVRFSAFDRRNSIPVKGRLKVISADHVVSPSSKMPFFKAIIEFEEDPEQVLNQKIHPGMQAEILIMTGKRTVLSYLISPITDNFSRAFTEQ